nr:vegetative cell wall protein gp1-like [Aegilops tauschii subsp. strangulata]
MALPTPGTLTDPHSSRTIPSPLPLVSPAPPRSPLSPTTSSPIPILDRGACLRPVVVTPRRRSDPPSPDRSILDSFSRSSAPPRRPGPPLPPSTTPAPPRPRSPPHRLTPSPLPFPYGPAVSTTPPSFFPSALRPRASLGSPQPRFTPRVCALTAFVARPGRVARAPASHRHRAARPVDAAASPTPASLPQTRLFATQPPPRTASCCCCCAPDRPPRPTAVATFRRALPRHHLPSSALAAATASAAPTVLMCEHAPRPWPVPLTTGPPWKRT